MTQFQQLLILTMLLPSRGLDIDVTDDCKTDCCVDSDCSGNETYCIMDLTGDYAQCVDCADELSFENSCQYWAEDIRQSAVAKCGYPCNAKAQCESNPSMKCCGDDECSQGEICVNQTSCDASEICLGTYSDCISCNPSDFKDSCSYYAKDFLPLAEEACHITDFPCNATVYCSTDETCINSTWPSYGDNAVCIHAKGESDDSYGQCIDCDEVPFQTSCGYWNGSVTAETEIRCNYTCGAPISCPNNPSCECCSNSDCKHGLSCALTPNKTQSMCVQCSPSDFKAACPYWTDEILAAAEETCGMSCSQEEGKNSASKLSRSEIILIVIGCVAALGFCYLGCTCVFGLRCRKCRFRRSYPEDMDYSLLDDKAQGDNIQPTDTQPGTQ